MAKIRKRVNPRRERAQTLRNAIEWCKGMGFNRGVAYVIRDRRLMTGVTDAKES